jgi:hypothetical protein
LVKKNQLVDEATANGVNKIGVEQLKIRSVLTCESDVEFAPSAMAQSALVRW